MVVTPEDRFSQNEAHLLSFPQYAALQERLNHMYDQIVYKDKNLLELNNKILEQERKMIDIQELVGEKNEVIRGRDKVIEVK